MSWFPGGSFRWKRCHRHVWAAAAGLKLSQTSHEVERSLQQRLESLRLVDEESREKVRSQATQLIEEFRAHEKIPGMVVAISMDGKMVYKKAFGYKDIENKVPATVDWKLHVASISKLLAAHCWMKYMQQNPRQYRRNWSLHDLISDFYEQVYVINLNERFFPLYQRPRIFGWKWNFRQNPPVPMDALLYHKTGMMHYHSQRMQYNYEKCSSQTAAFQEKLRMKFLQFFQYPPGCEYHYTSEGTNLIGVGLERLHQLSYKEFATNELKSLGMNESLFRELDDSYFSHSHGYAPGYTLIEPAELSRLVNKDVQMNEILTDLSNMHPAEGLVTTVGDLNKLGNIYANLFNKNQARNRPFDQLDGMVVRKMWSPHHCFLNNSLAMESCGLAWKLTQETEKMCRTTKKGKNNQERQEKGAQWCFKAWHDGMGLGSQSCLLVHLFRCRKPVIKERVVRDAWYTDVPVLTAHNRFDAYQLPPELLDVFKLRTQKAFIDNFLFKPDYAPLHALRLEYIRLMTVWKEAWSLRNELALYSSNPNSIRRQTLMQMQVNAKLQQLNNELQLINTNGGYVIADLVKMWSRYSKTWNDEVKRSQERIDRWREEQRARYDESRNRAIVEEEIKLDRMTLIRDGIQSSTGLHINTLYPVGEYFRFLDAMHKDLNYMGLNDDSFTPRYYPNRLCDKAFDPILSEQNYDEYQQRLANQRGGGERKQPLRDVAFTRDSDDDDEDLEQSSDLNVSREGFTRRCVVVAVITNQRQSALNSLTMTLGEFFSENYA